MFIVTNSQKDRLKERLSKEDYEKLQTDLSENRVEDFCIDLDEFIIDRFVNDEPTDKARELQSIYDEIIAQN